MPLFKGYILHYSFFYLSAVQNSQESLVVMTLQCLNAFCNNFFVTTSADGSADTLLHIQMAVSYKARYLSHFRLPIVVGPRQTTLQSTSTQVPPFHAVSDSLLPTEMYREVAGKHVLISDLTV